MATPSFWWEVLCTNWNEDKVSLNYEVKSSQLILKRIWILDPRIQTQSQSYGFRVLRWATLYMRTQIIENFDDLCVWLRSEKYNFSVILPLPRQPVHRPKDRSAYTRTAPTKHSIKCTLVQAFLPTSFCDWALWERSWCYHDASW